jgi:hypothetical protein
MILSNRNTMALGEQIEESRGKITGRRVFKCKGDTKNGNLFCDGGIIPNLFPFRIFYNSSVSCLDNKRLEKSIQDYHNI